MHDDKRETRFGSDSVYWLEGIPTSPELTASLSTEVDVAIVGSGYTGLHTALETARAGRTTLVMDAEEPGWGCSTRNGGQISTSVKPSLEKLTTRYGRDKAHAIRQEGETALEWIEDFIQHEHIDCDFRRNGRFHAAHTPAHYEELCKDAELLTRNEGIEVQVIPASEQRRELGTDCYHGGLVFPRHASIHPAKYHHGLLTAALSAGAKIMGHCAVKNIVRESDHFTLQTQKGPVRARDVVIATNGYTTRLCPWLQRRVIPIGSYIIATEPLPKPLINELFPNDRIASDTCKVVYYYRASPDRRRVLFGGRVSARETDTQVSGPRLFDVMCRIFPQLHDYGITHSWMGRVAYTFDELAHIGKHQGMYYAMGYCGSGVSMASYLGKRLGQKILGGTKGQTAFDDLNHPTRPFYTGNPWFLPASVAWYRMIDKRQYSKAAKGRS
jgi:glycine/D-amino acid oxidase-like deaminating enzyme